MARVHWAACALVLLCPLALSRHDDDFAFDSDDVEVELTADHSALTKNGLRRLWGVPDATAYVGHLFRMEIPKQAFSGDVRGYKVRTESGRRLPGWLAVDSRHGLISGIPQPQDLGTHTLTVTAHGSAAGLTATDSFALEVKKSQDKPYSRYGSCSVLQHRLVLLVLVDSAFQHVSPRQRIRALMDLANFMALDGDEFSIEPYKAEATRDQTVLMSGPGTAQRRRSEAATAIYLNVGCGDRLWPRHKVLVAGLREQSRDGTLSHTLKLPVLGWRLLSLKPAPRSKRQLPVAEGSGNFYEDGEDDDEYSGYGDDDDDYGGVDLGPDTDATSDSPPAHAHRHHHGAATAPSTLDDFQTADVTTTPPAPPPTTTTTTTTTTPTPPPTTPATEASTAAAVLTTVEVTAAEITTAVTTQEDKVKIEPYPEQPTASSNISSTRVLLPTNTKPRLLEDPDFTDSDITIDGHTTPEMDTQTVIIRASNETPRTTSEQPPSVASPSPATEPTEIPVVVATPAPTTPSTTTTTTTTTHATPVTTPTLPPTTPVAEATLPEVITEQETPSSTERATTVIGRTTETVYFPMMNRPPSLEHHMKKLAITAGKAFRYIIPNDLFVDPEDGNELNFTLYKEENVPLSSDSWVQFIPALREVYGLPLEAHVSRWNYMVEARDSGGEVARGPLDITVQQYRGGRTINHQFVLQFKLNRPYEHPIDWQIRALEGIVNLFRDTDMEHLTVLNATQNGEMYEFVWTNDTLPKDPCPFEDIKRLMKIMESPSEAGSPSAALARAFSPDLKVATVSWRGVGLCAARAPARPDTYPPVPRNQVDHLTATVGTLLRYTVPEDTFFDPEDGDTRHLQLSLRYSDRAELPRAHWLQFDANNQEFYGLPADHDVGSVQYQLVAEDSSKKSAYDSLIVEVVRAPAIRPTVEFAMTLDKPAFEQIAYSAKMKRRIVENLAALFGDTETASIRIQNITDSPTTIVWYNTSLPMDRCPKKEIEELRGLIIHEEGSLKETVDQIFDKDFQVNSISLLNLGLCAEQNTKVAKPPPARDSSHVSNKAGAAADGYTEYLVTVVIPAVVIVCMLLVAGVIACVLYRRRRTGKMSVGDEEERQAFRSKGIPVIFQDELEEQGGTEPLHKSPVIMREEKPPLCKPAPDYRNSAPYRPPPPVAPASSPPRHKATPTYRKPPPYVPP